MIETLCQECGRPLSFPNQYAGTARACHFRGSIVSLPEREPPSARLPATAQKSVRMKRKQGPLGIDRGLFIFAALFLTFSVLLCITGALTGQTGSPFSLSLFVLGFIVLVISLVGVGLALYDVDILSQLTRASFTLTSALLVFVPGGALGILTAILTYSP